MEIANSMDVVRHMQTRVKKMSAMPHNFYQMLDLEYDADLAQIKRAIHFYRKRDKQGQYTSALDQIERVLTDPYKRAQYDKELNMQDTVLTQPRPHHFQNDDFLDIGSEQFFNESEKSFRKKTGQEKKNKVLYGSSLDLKYKAQKAELSVQKSALLTAIPAVMIVIALWATVPTYWGAQAKAQTAQAIDALEVAKEQVLDSIRVNHVFPQSMNFAAQNDAVHSIRLEGDQLVLTFNSQAVDVLRNTSITYTAVPKPNMPLQWWCEPSPGFPAKYRPSTCY